MSSRIPGTRQCVTASQVRVRSPRSHVRRGRSHRRAQGSSTYPAAEAKRSSRAIQSVCAPKLTCVMRRLVEVALGAPVVSCCSRPEGRDVVGVLMLRTGLQTWPGFRSFLSVRSASGTGASGTTAAQLDGAHRCSRLRGTMTAAEGSCRMRAEGLLCASVDPLSCGAGDAFVLRHIHTRSALAVGFEQAGEPWKTSERPTMRPL